MSNVIDSIQLSGVTYAIQGSGGGGIPESAFTAYTASTDSRIAEDEEVTAAGLNALNAAISGISGNNVVELTQAQYDALVTGGTVDPSAFYIITDATAGDLTQYWTSAQTQSAITAATSTKQDTLVSGTNIKTINNESILGSGNIDIQGGGGGGKAISAGTNISVTTGETADTINCTLPIREGSHSSGKGIIVGDSECSSTGTYSISFGHNADVSGSYSLCMGSNSSCKGQQSIVIGDGSGDNGAGYTYCFGRNLHPNRIYQFLEGANLHNNNEYEVAFGQYNVSSKSSNNYGDSGNTLFSIGNGYDVSSTHNWHNAFEIRQNGDIYIANTNDTSITGDKAYSLYPMIKLQDALGGGGSITIDPTLDSGSTNAVANSAITAQFNTLNARITEDEEVTAAGLNSLNDKFGGLKLVKLTQSEYNALSPNYDSNTLYVIVN